LGEGACGTASHQAQESVQALEKMLREPVVAPQPGRHTKTHLARLPKWMQQSAGMAQGKLITDAHLEELRGEPL